MAIVVDICPGLAEKRRLGRIKDILLGGGLMDRARLIREARANVLAFNPVLCAALERRASWIKFEALLAAGYGIDEALVLVGENLLEVDGLAGSGQP